MALASRNPEEKQTVALKSETLIGLLQLSTAAVIGSGKKKYIYMHQIIKKVDVKTYLSVRTFI